MNFVFNEKILEKSLQDVYELIKTPISVLDKNFELKASYPPVGYLTNYCQIIRQSPLRKNLCLDCDRKACSICKDTKKTYSYKCHAHLCETVSPIYYDNIIAGFFLFGQYIDEKDTKKVQNYAKEQKINADTLLNYYNKLTILSPAKIQATCNILQASIMKMWATDAIRRDDDNKIEKIREYILNHLYLPLTVDFLCKKFYIDRQQLHHLFRENNHITLKQYILKKKMDEAKKLLNATSLTITEIAEKVGFSDYNNFIQRFKKMIGITPKQYRKKSS